MNKTGHWSPPQWGVAFSERGFVVFEDLSPGNVFMPFDSPGSAYMRLENTVVSEADHTPFNAVHVSTGKLAFFEPGHAINHVGFAMPHDLQKVTR